MAIKESGLMGRQDKLLTFGATAALSATGDAICGKTAEYTDGVALDMGKGDLEGMSAHFTVDTAINGTGTVTATFFVAVSDDKSNWTKIAVSPAIAKADLTEGAEFSVGIPRGHKPGQYVRAGVTMDGTTVTAGVVSACIDTFAGV